jgi:hypothetical protein
MGQTRPVNNLEVEASEREVARLEQKIGQLTMELDWLKKKSRQLGL